MSLQIKRTYTFESPKEEMKVFLNQESSYSEDNDIRRLNAKELEEIVSAQRVWNDMKDKHCKFRFSHCHCTYFDKYVKK